MEHHRRVGRSDPGLLTHHDAHYHRVGGGHACDATVAVRADPSGQPLWARHRTIDGKGVERLVFSFFFFYLFSLCVPILLYGDSSLLSWITLKLPFTA